ncbi:MAG: ATP-binding protein [Treponema sp.]|nr:ATP-binding protein [Treponema sp.]
MKLAWKLSIPQISIVVVLGLVAFITINSSFMGMRNQYVRDIVENRFQLITSGIEASAQKSVSEASVFVRLPVVMQAYEMAGRGNIFDIYSPQAQEAREFLRRELAPMLDSHYNATGSRLQLHFHLSNSHSLVRLWRDRQTIVDGVWVDISEDLRPVRQTVVDVNTSGEVARGIEPGSGGFSIRGVIPVIAPNGRQIGSAEVLQEFEPVIENVIEEGRVFISLYANSELREISVELQDQERYPPKGDFMRVVEARDGAVEDLITPELLSRGKEGIYFEDHPAMTLATYPLADYRGNQVGVIVCAIDTVSITALANAASVILAIMLAGMAIGPTFALLILLRRLVTSPLNMVTKTIHEIADNTADLSKQLPSHQKDEIGELSRWFNKLTAELYAEISQERDIIETMKDNIKQGIFLMDKDMKILPQYSKPLIAILSFYETELAGKNFLDILASSLDTKQRKIMQGYFSMMFSKSKSSKVLEAANPISEFEYKIDNKTKILSTRFQLIEQSKGEPVVIGLIQDITREKEYDLEIKAQKEAKERDMNDMFEVIQIDPIVFQDFIEDTEANFNYLNTILKDKSQTERHVVTKFFHVVHSTKSNAQILGLDNFAGKLHALENDVKAVSNREDVGSDEILSLAIKLETIMQEKDSYIKIFKKIEAYRAANKLDSVLLHGMNRAVEKLAEETNKKVELKKEHLDLGIIGSKLRKPIKDILFQCVRNSIYHGIETVEERTERNKRPSGLLTFSVRNVNGNAEIVFSDDGHGLDWDKIKARYLELHPGAQDTSKKALLASIFTPEFSTSDEISMVAGRGVGLSLVRDIVKENGGAISVNSSDHGLSLKFTFPLP